MNPLKVTAYLSSPIAVYDDWSPSLEAVVMYAILLKAGLADTNPAAEDVKKKSKFIRDNMPIKENGELGYYFCSAPIYNYLSEDTSSYRKRWEPNNKYINWGKRKASFSGSEGSEKNYDLPLYLRTTPQIEWYCLGDKAKLEKIFPDISTLGKKRSQGYGQVYKWEAEEISENWSLIKDNKLMKPLPAFVVEKLDIVIDASNFMDIMKWGWRPPAWLKENQDLCYMPKLVMRG